MSEVNDGTVNVEPTTTTPTVDDNNNKQTPTIDFEKILSSGIEKARKEEKDKLYPKIQKLEDEVNTKTEKYNALLLTSAEKDEVIKGKDAEIATLNEKIKKMEEEGATMGDKEKEIKALEEKLAQALKIIEDKDAEIAKKELDSYRAEKVKDIDESVIDLVKGNTKEEIDASVESAKAIYEKIAAKFTTPTSNIPQTVNTTVNKTPVIPQVQMNTLDNAFKDVKPEDLMNIDISTPEGRKAWKEARQRMGIK